MLFCKNNITKLHQLKLVQLKEELQKRNLATSGYRGALIARLTEALVNENENPDEFEFGDQDVELNVVVTAGANTKLTVLPLTIPATQLVGDSASLRFILLEFSIM
ncbi:hypothetical protein HELRODRAFT_164389 [Helobdella robusta]|uniref:SAP domain-containing protein n=1 Tax=Helobdella robusta TaxID=6412 RepID=T1EVD2_HELRO|nr:hypothetical protein HELRODRAFT_164389 [Helobdella robusta]ESN94533.1 hypothetical protein HELRODRAFT_164389 [Helobdella robusta]